MRSAALILIPLLLCRLDPTHGLAFTGGVSLSPKPPRPASEDPLTSGRLLCFATKRNHALIENALSKRFRYEIDFASDRSDAYVLLFRKSKFGVRYQAVISDEKTWDGGTFFRLLHERHMIPLRLLYSDSGLIEEDDAFQFYCDAFVDTPASLRGALALLTKRNKSVSLAPLQRIKFRVRTLLSLSSMRLTARVQRYLQLIERFDKQYQSATLLNSTATKTEMNWRETMKIVHISDTHSFHRLVELPPEGGDLLIHTGDICGRYDQRRNDKGQLSDFLWWLVSSKALERFKLVVFIAGNHDTVLDPRRCSPEDYKECMELIRTFEEEYPNLRYLCDSSLEWNGLHIYGTPTTICREEAENVRMRSSAFELTEEERLASWKRIPEDVDILLTHMPPGGLVADLCSQYDSCPMLTREIYSRPRTPLLHSFGHVHDGYGIGQHKSTLLTNGSQEGLLLNDKLGGGLPIVLNLPIPHRRQRTAEKLIHRRQPLSVREDSN